MQQPSSGTKGATRRNGVAVGSVWETRMKMDQVRGGIKVFDGEANREEEEGGEGGSNSKPGGVVSGVKVYARRLSGKGGEVDAATEKRKRRNWTPPEPDKNPIRIMKSLSRDENCGELGEEEEEQVEVEAGVEERKRFDDKEVDLAKGRGGIQVEEGVEEKKIDKICEVPISSNADKSPPEAAILQDTDLNCTKSSKSSQIEEEEEVDDFYESAPDTYNRMQGIVDLVMWRDISRSAFVFGVGTFLLISSSYTKDFSFSLISACSYLALFYLAAIFLYKAITNRVIIEEESDQKGVIGEQEAIWLCKVLLPYLNELLIKVKALFSGDPATTMKMAVLLFVLARCGGQITIWTMVKLAFFGLFTVPKLCSSYSAQLTRYGKFWIDRCRDAWDSCTHKKAAAAAAFTLVWNLSSTVARVWAVFMLVVALRYYQQHCLVVPEWDATDKAELDDDEEELQLQQKQQKQASQVVQRSPVGAGGHVRGSGVRHRQGLGGPDKGQVAVVVAAREKKRA